MGVDLPAEEWLRFFDELGEMLGDETCSLAGGEPFARPDLFELIDGIVRNRMRFSVLSNGTLITDEAAERLAGTGRCDARPGLDRRLLCGRSRYLPGKGTVREGRGRDPVLRSGTACRSPSGSPSTTGTSTTSRTRPGSCSRTSGSRRSPPMPRRTSGSAGSTPTGYRSRSRTGCTRMETLLALDARYGGRIAAQAGPLADARAWSEMIERHERGEGGTTDGGGFLTSCGCPFSSIAVRADGVFVPCSLLPMIELGRINRDPLREVWLRHPELVRFRERRKIPLLQFDECRSCRYSPFCRGGCPGVSASLTGSAYRPAPDDCLRRFLEAGGTVPTPAPEA